MFSIIEMNKTSHLFTIYKNILCNWGLHHGKQKMELKCEQLSC